LTDSCLVFQLRTANVKNIGIKTQARMQMLSPFTDSTVDNVLLQTSTSHFLSSSTFLNGVW